MSNAELTAEIRDLRQQLLEAQALNSAFERQAIISSTHASIDTPLAETIRLQSSLEGQSLIVQSLEAELASNATVSAQRLTALQDSFAAKVQGMRASHQEQVEAVKKEAREKEAVLEARIRELTKREEELRAQLSELSKREKERELIKGSTLEEPSATSAALLEEWKERAVAASARVEVLEIELERTREREKQPAEAPPAPQPSAAPSIDHEALMAMMEAQLGRLSEIIRQRDGEVASLRQAVTLGLEERRVMQRELAAAEERAQQHASASASSPGVDPSVAAFLNKPMRQGPFSKPKFK